MKNIALLILGLGWLCSCNKYTGGVIPKNTLNRGELKLIGNWTLREEADTVLVNGTPDTSLTKTYTAFAGTPYLSFASGDFGTPAAGGPNFKYMDDAAAVTDGYTPGYDRSSLIIPVKPSSWYCDTGATKLTLLHTVPEIQALTEDLLILKTTFTQGDTVVMQTLYFEK
jgi:hypothetical protein